MLYTHACMYVCMHMRACVLVREHACVCVHMIYVCTHIHIPTDIYTLACISTRTRTRTHHTNTHAHKQVPMLEFDTTKRATAAHMLTHPWLQVYIHFSVAHSGLLLL